MPNIFAVHLRGHVRPGNILAVVRVRRPAPPDHPFGGELRPVEGPVRGMGLQAECQLVVAAAAATTATTAAKIINDDGQSIDNLPVWFEKHFLSKPRAPPLFPISSPPPKFYVPNFSPLASPFSLQLVQKCPPPMFIFPVPSLNIHPKLRSLSNILHFFTNPFSPFCVDFLQFFHAFISTLFGPLFLVYFLPLLLHTMGANLWHWQHPSHGIQKKRRNRRRRMVDQFFA
jgi:hypothetical protein